MLGHTTRMPPPTCLTRMPSPSVASPPAPVLPGPPLREEGMLYTRMDGAFSDTPIPPVVEGQADMTKLILYDMR